ncbi:nucleoside monophosphate kinase [Candidatus Falkowbacteria bacterium]|nr:nucleoside monophosphate kinase [Candidatus Falkowbacteria bacterium]
MARLILFFFGSPGSGKGTQATSLSQQLGLPAISTGDLLRQHNQLSGEYSAAMNEGQLVDDELINDLLAQRLAQPDVQRGFILDGYPRNKAQFEHFYNEIIGREDQSCAIEISVSEPEVYNRLSGRRFCPKCGAGYHLIYKPSQHHGICDNCQTALEQRSDDSPEVIKDRLALYQRTMGPLVALWWQLGELVIIKGEKDIEAVHDDILLALQERGFLKMKPEIV